MTEGELPGGFRGNARLRDSGDSGHEGEDQEHFSKLFKIRFIKDYTEKSKNHLCFKKNNFVIVLLMIYY